MADYPNAIYEQRELENLPGLEYDANNKKTLYAEDMRGLGDEVTAIETTLGINPEGEYATVAERLDNSGGGGGNWELIFNETTTTDLDYFDITGLDLNADERYKFYFRLTNKGYDNGFRWRVNGASSTYYGNGAKSSGTSYDGSTSWENWLIANSNLPPNMSAPCWGYIEKSPYGTPMMTGWGVLPINSTTYVRQTSWSCMRTSTDNLTYIRIVPTEWNLYEGSVFRVWKEVL